MNTRKVIMLLKRPVISTHLRAQKNILRTTKYWQAEW